MAPTSLCHARDSSGCFSFLASKFLPGVFRGACAVLDTAETRNQATAAWRRRLGLSIDVRRAVPVRANSCAAEWYNIMTKWNSLRTEWHKMLQNVANVRTFQHCNLASLPISIPWPPRWRSARYRLPPSRQCRLFVSPLFYTSYFPFPAPSPSPPSAWCLGCKPKRATT